MENTAARTGFFGKRRSANTTAENESSFRKEKMTLLEANTQQEYIIKEIKDCELIVISNLLGISHFIDLTYNLNLQDFVKFIGYSSKPEIYFKNASLNFFPSISESFGLVLSEANIHGIPSILLGLDYISIVNKGTVIVYDDSPESLSRESIKLLHNNNINYRKKLGKMELPLIA